MSETTPQSTRARAIQATVVATMAAVLVVTAAALSGSLFDRLPPYLDVVLVVFVFPIFVLVGIFFFDAKLITPRYPSWLRKSDGREADLPSLLVGPLLAASIAAIYPGMFPARDYANLILRGAAFDVEPERAPGNAAYYRFRDATLRADLAGSRSRTVIVRQPGNTGRKRRVTHVAPIVGRSWRPSEPVVAWAISEEQRPLWWLGPVSELAGLRLPDERNHALRAVETVALERRLELGPEPILIDLGESYSTLLERSRRRTFMVLAPLSIVVFVGVGWRTWAILDPLAPRHADKAPGGAL